MPANVAGLLKNSFIWIGRISYTYKKIILKGTEFRGGSDEKMRRMWLRREIVVVGLPSLVSALLQVYDVGE